MLFFIKVSQLNNFCYISFFLGMFLTYPNFFLFHPFIAHNFPFMARTHTHTFVSSFQIMRRLDYLQFKTHGMCFRLRFNKVFSFKVLQGSYLALAFVVFSTRNLSWSFLCQPYLIDIKKFNTKPVAQSLRCLFHSPIKCLTHSSHKGKFTSLC